MKKKPRVGGATAVITPTATTTARATMQMMMAVISNVTPVFVLPLLAPTVVSAKQVIPSNIDIAAAVSAEVIFFIIKYHSFL